MNPSKRLLPALGIALLQILLLTPPSLAQDATPDSSAEESETPAEESEAPEGEERLRRWGVGLQATPLFGLSVRYAFTERFAVQVAGMPFPLDEERAVGGRLLFKLYTEPSYNFYVAGGSAATFGESRVISYDEGRFTQELDGYRTYSFFATLGGEYRFAERLGLGIGLGLKHREWRARYLHLQRSLSEVVVGLGLHYYF